MNEVYVIAGGEWLRNNLNAIAAFMGTRTWDSIEKIALTLSVLAVAVMWVQRHNVMDLLGWVAVFVLISLLVNVRTSVQIIDNSDLVKVHRVDNVPVGLAMPLSLTTRTGIFSRRSMPVILLCWAFWLCDWYDAGADSAY